jgi:phosphodiesterase/alkaline phosphatase D-like protein
MTTITRRLALKGAMLGAAACANFRSETKLVPGAPGGGFAHGVASGDPEADSVVLWTRVTPAGQSPVPVGWEIARDDAFQTIAGAGETAARPESDFTVKIVAEDLDPGQRYFFRFRTVDSVSPVGRTRTAPNGAVAKARFAIVSCSNYPFGYFNVYDRIAKEPDLDAVLHLGDYLYEYSREDYGGNVGAALGREHQPPHELVTLADYRRRHAQYKADAAAQAMHAAHPIIAIWDDHESANDSWRDGAENHDPQKEGAWAARKRAALQAYYEWMPVREPKSGAPREALFRAFSWGDLLTIAALETRLMARARQLQYEEIVPRLTSAEAVAAFREQTLWAADREMMGPEQLAFVGAALAKSAEARQPWRFIANQVIMAKVTAPNLAPLLTEADIAALESQWPPARAFIRFSALGLPVNLDAWDGYPAARQRFYDAVKAAGADGLIVLTGDTHTWWANDLVAEDGSAVGVELGVHSVTSPSPYRKEFLGGKGAEYALMTVKENKDVRYISGEHHGYIALDVAPEAVEARYVAVDTIEGPDYRAFDKAAFVIRKAAGVAAFAEAKGLNAVEQALF